MKLEDTEAAVLSHESNDPSAMLKEKSKRRKNKAKRVKDKKVDCSIGLVRELMFFFWKEWNLSKELVLNELDLELKSITRLIGKKLFL